MILLNLSSHYIHLEDCLIPNGPSECPVGLLAFVIQLSLWLMIVPSVWGSWTRQTGAIESTRPICGSDSGWGAKKHHFRL